MFIQNTHIQNFIYCIYSPLFYKVIQYQSCIFLIISRVFFIISGN